MKHLDSITREARRAGSPAPSASSLLEVRFKPAVHGSRVSGVLNLATSCHVKGPSLSRVAFFLDAVALEAGVPGMHCLLDSTRFANGVHQLKAVAFDAGGASCVDVVSINIQNDWAPLARAA
ncbi:MAG TPA: hypothetical protein VFX09_05685 [Burkholderiales bacterium]|nr:hypothetical protein [Burkholderiales bacterium]